AGREVRHRQLTMARDPLHQLERSLQLLGLVHQFFLTKHGELLHLFHDGPNVPYRFHDVARPGLTLRADHGRAFGDAAQGLTEIACAADERHLEILLGDVVLFIGRREDFAFIDIVDTERLEYPSFHEVANTRFSHYRDR